MAITKTYSLEFVRNLDLTGGAAHGVTVNHVYDAIGLAGGGFAVTGSYDYPSGPATFTGYALEIFNGSSATHQSVAQDLPYQPGLAQLSNGNLAVAGYISYAIYTGAAGTVLAPAGYSTANSAYPVSVTALTGGGFVVSNIASGTLDGTFRIFNNAGVELLSASHGFASEKPVVAGLDDGGFAVAWIDGGSVYSAVYNANGTVRNAPHAVDVQGSHHDIDITATDGGYAIVYEDDAFSANFDIALMRFDASGAELSYVTLSGPATIDEAPQIGRLSDGLLAIAFGYAYVGPADSDIFAGIFDPATGTFSGTRTVTAGQPLTDDTDLPILATNTRGEMAVFLTNRTDNDAQGEQLRVVRTSEGDGDSDFVQSDDDDYADVANGGNGNDYLYGGANNDTLSGGNNDDILGGDAGDDVLDGGAGNDTAVFYGGSAGVTVDLTITTSQLVGGGLGRDTLTGIENLEGGNFADRLTGDNGANTLDANLGADTLTGGLGNDIYVVRDALVKTVEAANGGIDLVISTGATHTLQANVENLTIVYENGSYVGSVQNATGNGLANIITGNNRTNTLDGLGGNDTIDGAGGDDSLKGGDGNDTLSGGGVGEDNDTLDGGAGADEMAGGGGNDTFYIDNAGDRIFDNTSTNGGEDFPVGTDTVYASITYTLTFATILHLLPGAANGTGNGFDNEIFGNAAANALDGGTGADTLHGGDGNDTLGGGDEMTPNGGAAWADAMDGGAGNDTYFVEALDSVVERAGEGTDTVQSEVTFTLGDNIERLFITGPFARDGTGNSLANLILGNDAINTLNGRDGDDTLNGGGGADTINGGSGLDRLIGGLQRDKIIPGADSVRDTIVFTLIGESTGFTRDVITGLDLANEDKLDLPGTVSSIAAARSGALSLATFNQNLASVFTAAALPVNSAALFTATSGDLVNPNMVYLIVDANGVAGYQANQDWVFQLENHTGGLDTSDFI